MFKNLNHNLVYKYPLIWNTKIVPFVLLALVLHILFFAVGYQNSMINSLELHDYYNESKNVETITVFAVVISLLLFIIWCVLYFKNNAFKAFYPKGNLSLFKEWLLILVFCIFNFSYAFSALFGANVQTRNIMPRQVAFDRCETISRASIFLNGSFDQGMYYQTSEYQQALRKSDSFAFEGRTYALNSLMNKSIESFPFFTVKEDSLRRLQVQRWMKENDKDAIYTIFKKYLDISKIHRLKATISAREWMDLVYDFPEFTNYKIIGTAERDLEYNYDYKHGEVAVDAAAQVTSAVNAASVVEPVVELDTTAYTLKTVEGQEYVYAKYYVSHKTLERYYSKIAKSWEDDLLDFELIIIMLYLNFAVSIVVFSFRVTSARSWIIALISLGIVSIFAGLLAFVFYSGITFPVLYLLYFFGVVIYFGYIYTKRKGKGFSAIALNQLLWMIPAFFPLIYVTVLDLIKSNSGYYDRYDLVTGTTIEEFPVINWLEDNAGLLAIGNLLLVALVLLVLAVIIKKWRGIPEE